MHHNMIADMQRLSLCLKAALSCNTSKEATSSSWQVRVLRLPWISNCPFRVDACNTSTAAVATQDIHFIDVAQTLGIHDFNPMWDFVPHFYFIWNRKWIFARIASQRPSLRLTHNSFSAMCSPFSRYFDFAATSLEIAAADDDSEIAEGDSGAFSADAALASMITQRTPLFDQLMRWVASTFQTTLYFFTPMQLSGIIYYVVAIWKYLDVDGIAFFLKIFCISGFFFKTSEGEVQSLSFCFFSISRMHVWIWESLLFYRSNAAPEKGSCAAAPAVKKWMIEGVKECRFRV